MVTIPEVPGAITQVRRLDQVTKDAGEVLKLMGKASPDQYLLHLEAHYPGDHGVLAEQAAGLRRQAEELDQATRDAVPQPERPRQRCPGSGSFVKLAEEEGVTPTTPQVRPGDPLSHGYDAIGEVEEDVPALKVALASGGAHLELVGDREPEKRGGATQRGVAGLDGTSDLERARGR